MPVYHFHVHNSVDARDGEGIWMTDLEAAQAAALTGARHFMSSDIKTKGRICLSYSIEITDPEGRQLCVVRYADAVEICP